jgi:hypothetical protein
VTSNLYLVYSDAKLAHWSQQVAVESKSKPSIAEVKYQLDKWRKERGPNSKKPLPEALWKQVVALTDYYKPGHVAYHLRLNNGSLKKNILKYKSELEIASKSTPSSDFVAVQLSAVVEQTDATTTQTVEFERVDGTKLRFIITADKLNSLIDSFFKAPLCCK